MYRSADDRLGGYAIPHEPIGRLEPVDRRKAWESESGDFTPWLAREENLKLLGEGISR